jgi:hypothetical protein
MTEVDSVGLKLARSLGMIGVTVEKESWLGGGDVPTGFSSDRRDLFVGHFAVELHADPKGVGAFAVMPNNVGREIGNSLASLTEKGQVDGFPGPDIPFEEDLSARGRDIDDLSDQGLFTAARPERADDCGFEVSTRLALSAFG